MDVLLPIIFVLITSGVAGAISYWVFRLNEERKQLQHTAYQEGIGKEYDRELRRLLEIQSLRPNDAPPYVPDPDPFREALVIARLERDIRKKNVPSMTFNFSNSAIAVNQGNVLGDLKASVQNLASHGEPQIADAIEKLASAINKSTEIKDADRKHLLENLTQISDVVSSEPDRRKPGG